MGTLTPIIGKLRADILPLASKLVRHRKRLLSQIGQGLPEFSRVSMEVVSIMDGPCVSGQEATVRRTAGNPRSALVSVNREAPTSTVPVVRWRVVHRGICWLRHSKDGRVPARHGYHGRRMDWQRRRAHGAGRGGEADEGGPADNRVPPLWSTPADSRLCSHLCSAGSCSKHVNVNSN